MPRLGQHFLKNPAALKKIVDAIAPARGETVIEIGPGHGELTIPLEERCRAEGCALIAIERDPNLAAALKATDIDGLTIIEGDALKELGPAAGALGSGRYVIAGNIPYYLTGKLLRTIGELPRRPERAVFTMQKEVAERICSEPPRMNRLAASIRFWATPKIIAVLPKGDFSPPPDVDSATLLLTGFPSSSEIDEGTYYRAVRALFAQPRKTIFNNLRAATRDGRSEDDIRTALMDLGILPEARPQDLAIQSIEKIAKALFSGDNRA